MRMGQRGSFCLSKPLCWAMLLQQSHDSQTDPWRPWWVTVWTSSPESGQREAATGSVQIGRWDSAGLCWPQQDFSAQGCPSVQAWDCTPNPPAWGTMGLQLLGPGTYFPVPGGSAFTSMHFAISPSTKLLSFTVFE